MSTRPSPRRRLPALLALLLASLWLQGCIVHRVRVESEPPGAVVRLDGRVKGVTPLEFNTVWVPALTRTFPKAYKLRVTLPGYRPVTTSLRADVRLWRYLIHPFRVREMLGLRPRSIRRVVLVARHGPAGTWGPEDVP